MIELREYLKSEDSTYEWALDFALGLNIIMTLASPVRWTVRMAVDCP